MVGYEKFEKILKGELQNTIPYTLTTSLYGSKFVKNNLKEYYTDPEVYCQGQLELIKKFDLDLLFAPFALIKEVEAFGGEIKYFDNQAPNLRKPVIKDLKNIDQLKLPDIEKSPSLQYILNSLKLMKEKIKDRPIAVVMTSPMDLPALLLGVDNWLELLLFNKIDAKKVLDICSEFFINWSEKLINYGVDFLMIPIMFCNPRISTKNIITEFAIPNFNRVFKNIEIPIIFHHGGNRIDKFMELFKQIKNISAFVIDSRDDISLIRKAVGNNYILIGNLPGPVLGNISNENIKKLVLKILDETKNDPLFILGSSGADINLDTSEEKIKLIIETIKGYHRCDVDE